MGILHNGVTLHLGMLKSCVAFHNTLEYQINGGGENN